MIWHPKNMGEVALGTEDGRVGLYDISGGRANTVSVHRGQVNDLTWAIRDDEYGTQLLTIFIL